MSNRAQILSELWKAERALRRESRSGAGDELLRGAADLLRAVIVAAQDRDELVLLHGVGPARRYLKEKHASPYASSREWLVFAAQSFDSKLKKENVRDIDLEGLVYNMLGIINRFPCSRLGARLRPLAAKRQKSFHDEQEAVFQRVKKKYVRLLDCSERPDGEALIRHGLAAWLDAPVSAFKDLFAPHGARHKRE